MSTAPTDPYLDNPLEDYPGARKRSKPGTDPTDQVYEKVPGPNGTYVSSKPANKPFLSSRTRQQAHNAKLASLQTKSNSSPPSKSRINLKSILLFFLFLPLLSQFLTHTYTFSLSPRLLPPIQKYIRTSPLNPWRVIIRDMTIEELSSYDGENGRGLYLGVGGEVYDVGANRRIYGKGGSYGFMAARDVSRAFITGCFETHLTHDLRGLSTDQLKALENWKTFFANHAKYRHVAHLILPPIDPSTPIPPPCRDSAEPPTSAHHPKPSPVQATAAS